MPDEIIKEKSLFTRFLKGADVQIRKEGDKKTLTFPVSSEEPVDRWYGTEIISHDKGSIRMDRANKGAMPLLFNHNIDDPIGMIDRMWIEDKRAMVDAHLFNTSRADEIMSMIEGGLKNVSIAYRSFVIEEDKKTETFIVKDTEIYEVSIVTVPADPTVGIGRGISEYEVRMVRASLQPADAAKEVRMTPEEEKAAEAAREKERIAEVVRVEMAAASKASQGSSAVEFEQSRKRAIENLCKANKLDDKYKDYWIGAGLSIEAVSDDILRILEERGKTNPQPASMLGLTPKETQKFSLIRAIAACADNDWTNAPFELECSREVAKKLNKVVDTKRFLVPFEVLQRPVVNTEKRDLTVGTAGAGGYLVATDNIGFIEMLRNRSVAFRMGARTLSGLQGNVTIPRQSAAGTAYWLATEATAITEAQQTFVQVALTPKTAGAYTEVSRLLMLQSSPGAEGIVTDDLARIVATAADLAVLNGSGASGQPLGIIGTSGIGGVTGTSLAYADILEFQEDVATSNVIPVAGGYVTTPAVASLMMQRQRFTSTDTPLWQGNIWDGIMSGFPAMSSNQMPAADMLFGDWQEVVVGEWGVLEIQVNPYANFAAGIIGIRAMYTLDVGVRRPFAFSLATSIT